MIFDYRTAAVRDIAWIIGSPPLYQPSPGAFAHWPTAVDCRDLLLKHRSWLASLDQSPDPLEDYIKARPTRRLGQYFETLVAFWLSRGPYTDLRAANVPVRDGAATVGELDFVYDVPAEPAIVHLEVAVKFYLRVDSADDASAYIGPGLRDRFDLKLGKLVEAQSRRANHPAAQRVLQEKGLSVSRAQVLLKGVLFEPWEPPLAPRPVGVPKTSLRGRWLTFEQLKSFRADGEWYALERLRWLTGPAHGTSPLDRDALIAQAEASWTRPVQAMHRTDDGVRRYFLVPDDFLERARQRRVQSGL